MNPKRILPFLGLALLVALPACGEEEGVTQAMDVHTVKRGDLRITVREQGEIQAAQNTRIASQMEGRATLIYLIPEGSTVRQGERLAELDVSDMEDRLANQAIAVAKAEAALEQAKKNFDIMENSLVAAREAAESTLELARMRRDKFMGQASARQTTNGSTKTGTNAEMVEKLQELLDNEFQRNAEAEVNYAGLVTNVMELLESEENLALEMGEMATQILRKIETISMAQAKLFLDEDTLRHSERLREKEFITRNQLDSDRLNYANQLSTVTTEWIEFEVLIKFTLRETKITLRQDIRNAELNLDSVIATNEATRVREEAELISKQAEYDLAKEREVTYREQIDNAIILAPTPGLVVYAQEGGGRGRQPVEEGIELRERQAIINLPDTTKMVAELKVHEAQVDQVVLTQPAVIKVDAFPERTFTGRVSRVSSLPDSGSRFNNNDLKVYKTTVTLDGENSDGALRPGMNATIEIHIGTRENVVNVPLPGVQYRGEVVFAWKITPEGPIATQVRIGANNMSHVEIVEGLEEGDQIFLGTPPDVEDPEFEQPEEVPFQDAISLEPGSVSQAAMNRAPEEGRERGGRRGGRGGRGGANTEFLNALQGFLVSEWPDRAEELQDQRNWFRMLGDPGFQGEVEGALESRSDLMGQWQAYREQRAANRNRGGEGFGRGDRSGGQEGRQRGNRRGRDGL